jgi:sRNA-binding protein
MPAPEQTRPMLKLRVSQRARTLLQSNEPLGSAGAVLKSALAYWTGRRGYQEALAAGMVRYGLNGEIAGEVTDTERQHAAAPLAPSKGAGQ